MEINYRTKEESNRIQKQEFLALTPHERIMHFLKISEQVSQFKTKTDRAQPEKNNFILEMKNE